MNNLELINSISPLIKRLIPFSLELCGDDEKRQKIIENAWVNFLIEEKEYIGEITSEDFKTHYRKEAFTILLRNMVEESLRLKINTNDKFYSIELFSRIIIFLKDKLNINYESLEFITSLDSKTIIEFYFNGKRKIAKIENQEKMTSLNYSEICLNLTQISNDIIIPEKTNFLQKIGKILDTTILEF